MDTSQITQIAIKVGEAGTKASLAFWIAIISALAAIAAALIAGFFKWQLNKANQQYQKQWAFISKKTALFDAAIEICSRMLWNKLLLSADRFTAMANDNLFLLYKDSVVVETQLLLYGNQNLANAFVAAREKIIGTPNDKIIAEWTNIVEECRKQIYELKHDLYGAITEEYKTFAEKLKPPVVSASTDDAVKKIGSQLTQ